ncbi:MAG: hypothetical protein KC476_02145 [Cyanobacteria bacterium HKST-UBA06]|nr:hypothetical protein [Cyanobacteria bacterium HKST-UBA06]
MSDFRIQPRHTPSACQPSPDPQAGSPGGVSPWAHPRTDQVTFGRQTAPSTPSTRRPGTKPRRGGSSQSFWQRLMHWFGQLWASLSGLFTRRDAKKSAPAKPSGPVPVSLDKPVAARSADTSSARPHGQTPQQAARKKQRAEARKATAKLYGSGGGSSSETGRRATPTPTSAPIPASPRRSLRDRWHGLVAGARRLVGLGGPDTGSPATSTASRSEAPAETVPTAPIATPLTLPAMASPFQTLLASANTQRHGTYTTEARNLIEAMGPLFDGMVAQPTSTFEVSTNRSAGATAQYSARTLSSSAGAALRYQQAIGRNTRAAMGADELQTAYQTALGARWRGQLALTGSDGFTPSGLWLALSSLDPSARELVLDTNTRTDVSRTIRDGLQAGRRYIIASTDQPAQLIGLVYRDGRVWMDDSGQSNPTWQALDDHDLSGTQGLLLRLTQGPGVLVYETGLNEPLTGSFPAAEPPAPELPTEPPTGLSPEPASLPPPEDTSTTELAGPPRPPRSLEPVALEIPEVHQIPEAVVQGYTRGDGVASALVSPLERQLAEFSDRTARQLTEQRLVEQPRQAVETTEPTDQTESLRPDGGGVSEPDRAVDPVTDPPPVPPVPVVQTEAPPPAATATPSPSPVPARPSARPVTNFMPAMMAVLSTMVPGATADELQAALRGSRHRRHTVSDSPTAPQPNDLERIQRGKALKSSGREQKRKMRQNNERVRHNTAQANARRGGHRVNLHG